MAEEKKARIFLRRGLDADRQNTKLCEGELGYSTDAKRVFVGDDSTGGLPLSVTHFIPNGTSITTLNDVTVSRRAEIGDFAAVESVNYNLEDVNVNLTGNTVIAADANFATLYSLSARDNANNLTWMALNSGIPLTHINIPLDGLSADQVHGGDFSGDVTFSGTVCAASLTAVNLSAQGISALDLAGSGTRVVYATSTGELSTKDSEIQDANIITVSQYFNKQNLISDLEEKIYTTAWSPKNSNSDWTVTDLSSHLTAAGVNIPSGVYPKAAVISVYTVGTPPKADRMLWSLYSAHVTSGNYHDSANYNVVARWGSGQGGKGDDWYSWGGTFTVRLNGANNNLILQYTRNHDEQGNSSVVNTDADIAIDLIGIMY